MVSKPSIKEMEELLGRYIRLNGELLKEIDTLKAKLLTAEYWSKYFCRELIHQVQYSDSREDKIDILEKDLSETEDGLAYAQSDVCLCEYEKNKLEVKISELQKQIDELTKQQTTSGVGAEAVVKEIWNAFVKQYHPDTVHGDSVSKAVRQEVFKEMQQIFDVARNKLKQKKST